MPPTPKKPSVFISYRRDDSAGWAGRLEDDLADHFGAQRVFRDVKIPVGVDYEQHIEHMLDTCHVVIVVIGPNWMTLTDAAGRLRLAQSDDVLRREIERALQRRDVDVIPVLVQRAHMPAAHELPFGLQPLARRQAIELSDSRWSHDMGKLIAHLCDVLEGTTAVHPQVRSTARRSTSPPEIARAPVDDGGPSSNRERVTAAGTMLAAAAVGIVIASTFTSSLAEGRRQDADHDERLLNYAGERAVLWAFAGALVLAVAAMMLRSGRARAIGAMFSGLAYGAVSGGVSGAAYMALKDQNVLQAEWLLRGVTAAIVGIVLASALAKLLSADPGVYVLSGVAGGLVAGFLAYRLFDNPDPQGALAMNICEAIVTTAALALVAAPNWRAIAGGAHVLART